jgi:hypothetical protein
VVTESSGKLGQRVPTLIDQQDWQAQFGKERTDVGNPVALDGNRGCAALRCFAQEIVSVGLQTGYRDEEIGAPDSSGVIGNACDLRISLVKKFCTGEVIE